MMRVAGGHTHSHPLAEGATHLLSFSFFLISTFSNVSLLLPLPFLLSCVFPALSNSSSSWRARKEVLPI